MLTSVLKARPTAAASDIIVPVTDIMDLKYTALGVIGAARVMLTLKKALRSRLQYQCQDHSFVSGR